MDVLNTDNRYRHQSRFFCPTCTGYMPYSLKPTTLRTRFYYIPLFENGNLDQVIECQNCKKGFDPRILGSRNQTLLKLACVAKFEMKNGATPEQLKAELISDGLSENLANQLIKLAEIN